LLCERFIEPSLVDQHLAERHLGARRVRMLGAERLAHDRQRALAREQRILVLVAQDLAQ
jgi:hypothetical protein